METKKSWLCVSFRLALFAGRCVRELIKEKITRVNFNVK